MEIKSLYPASYLNPLEPTQPATPRAESQDSAPQGDTVDLSSNGRLMGEIRQVASQSPDIRQEKVDAIKAQLAAGTYQIDSKNIAQKLIQSEEGLFN